MKEINVTMEENIILGEDWWRISCVHWEREFHAWNTEYVLTIHKRETKKLFISERSNDCIYFFVKNCE
jgi:hypothetical protein